MSTEENIARQLEKMKRALEVLGLNPSATEEQLRKLSNIIFQAILNRIAREKGSSLPQGTEPTEENVAAFLQKHYSQEELNALLEEETTQKFEEYFTAISKNADSVTLNKAIQELST